MKKFKELDKRTIDVVEGDILNSWGGINNALNMQIEANKDNPSFVFYDGPAFANGFPGLHHMVAKNLKDIMCKYHSMNGKKIYRKIGWDTHGLPIENHVEKKLGLKTKKDIEDFGVLNFNNECRKSVRINEDAFVDLTSKMGQFIDTENPYITMDNDYIETEWWILKKMHDEGFFYEGNKVMPYCPSCGTGLSTHEVAQGYEDVSVDTVTVPFKLVDEDAYFLVWTTTPWTLIANVGLCVNPDEKYVKVKSMDNNFILAKDLVSSVLGDDVEILETYKGKDLEYKKYEQLLPFLKTDIEGFFVACDNYVTMDSGTGIVHIAPAFGEDDANVAKNYNLPFLNPVAENGTYNDGPWKDILVFDADLEVIKYLKENDKLFKKQKMTHNYPHCWRCSSPLLYYSRPAYYIAVSKIKDKLIEANNTINWYPSYVGEKRFGNWLSNARDWNVSRTRYWGSPIPYFKCECGHAEMIGSKKELIEKSIDTLDENIDLHKPYMDDVKLKCPKCSGVMNRIPDVLDCWFDSGSMPFAQYHYPFENEKLFDEQFPADFISEGIDQTRGWFYTLLVISVFVKGVAPFKNVLVNDLLLDSEGKKMSKSRGNIVEPFETIKQYGADAVRFYLLYTSPIWTPLKFDITGIKEVHSKFFNPLKNTYNFFSLYANTDNIDINKCNIDIKDREEIDKWIISRYNSVLKDVTDNYNQYDLHKIVKLLVDFVSEDLSNWYIRRNRNRFWDSELTNSKKAVYMTTYEVLEGICLMLAPIAPFVSEEIYRNLTGKKSVHTATFPKYDESLIDEKLEEKMILVRNLISVGRKVREEEKIKVRQPISKIMLDKKNEIILDDLVLLIKEELNVKEITFVDNLSDYMNLEVKPNFKVVGKVLGSKMNLFKEKMEKLSLEEINLLNSSKEITISLDNEDFVVNQEMIEIRVSGKEGLAVGTEASDFIILDTNLTEELVNEGIAREFISKIQNLRKELDFDVADRISITYNSSDEVKNAITLFDEFIKNETLGTTIDFDNNLTYDMKLNDFDLAVTVKRNN